MRRVLRPARANDRREVASRGSSGIPRRAGARSSRHLLLRGEPTRRWSVDMATAHVRELCERTRWNSSGGCRPRPVSTAAVRQRPQLWTGLRGPGHAFGTDPRGSRTVPRRPRAGLGRSSRDRRPRSVAGRAGGRPHGSWVRAASQAGAGETAGSRATRVNRRDLRPRSEAYSGQGSAANGTLGPRSSRGCEPDGTQRPRMVVATVTSTESALIQGDRRTGGQLVRNTRTTDGLGIHEDRVHGRLRFGRGRPLTGLRPVR